MPSHDDFDAFDNDDVDTEAAEPKRKPAAKRAPAKRPAARKTAANRAPKKPAAQREAERDEVFVLEYNGTDYEVPADPEDWPTIAVQHLTANRAADALELILGPVQWATFNRENPRLRDFRQFAFELGRGMGISLGN